MALDKRYQRALQDAADRGASDAVAAFEGAIASSKAVMSRPLRELDRLISSEGALISTYYNLLQTENHVPHGREWDGLRRIADEALFHGYRESIRFAVLSLDGLGLTSYGECSLVLRDSMISHRTSVFESDSAFFLKEHSYELSPGHRAVWKDRAKLAVAKLASEIKESTSQNQFPSILLREGGDGRDHFIEVHIWGPLSIETVEKVFLKALGKRGKAFRLALRDRLSARGVELIEMP